MSGGSFNYLCRKDASDLFHAGLSDAEEMIDALAGLGYAADAARETAALIADVNAAGARIDAKLERLRGVWKAMEWWRSCDWGEDQFRAALADYRGEASADPQLLDFVQANKTTLEAYCSGYTPVHPEDLPAGYEPGMKLVADATTPGVATPLSRIRELSIRGGEEDLEKLDSFTYSWDHGHETLRADGVNYSGTFHPGDGCCKGNPCRFCGRAVIE